nr:MAG TPA: hypothetical protein [Caudoviricetes sp.]DAT04531.1 MAG TPA: hypothetical protein [Bacteriophage sp.]
MTGNTAREISISQSSSLVSVDSLLKSDSCLLTSHRKQNNPCFQRFQPHGCLR